MIVRVSQWTAAGRRGRRGRRAAQIVDITDVERVTIQSRSITDSTVKAPISTPATVLGDTAEVLPISFVYILLFNV